MIGCDNAGCDSISDPERVGNKLYTPYGWIHLKGHRQGFGPNFDVTVCSADCVSPAINRKIEEDRP